MRKVRDSGGFLQKIGGFLHFFFFIQRVCVVGLSSSFYKVCLNVFFCVRLMLCLCNLFFSSPSYNFLLLFYLYDFRINHATKHAFIVTHLPNG